MSSLRPDDFDAYFEAVHGRPPFRWQRRLLQRVHAEGWPDQLDLPTGAGKTAALDVALFHMALEAERPPLERTAPRRVFLVVDRRLLVDQAHERAKRIECTLAAADEGILRRVADALRALAGRDAPPLVTSLLRGGMPRDRAWARTPDQPVLGVSTVDQVGSRLLFRGYGVSDAMRPLEAGLLGNDTLFLLDEVHLAEPFAQTLQALERYRDFPQRLCRRWRVVALSATVRTPSSRSFGLEADDRRDTALDQRLRASKPATLVSVPVKGEEDRRRDLFVEACAHEVRRLRRAGAHVVALMVNRVETARRVFDALADDADALLATEPSTHDADRVLLTGRMRPLDRDDVQKRLGRRVAAGRDDDGPRDLGRPLFVVATQCLEAGADYDFDALVTECASFDALRQRFGRLDRLGRHGQARGVIVARDDQVKEDATPDAVYGPALAATWKWLNEQPALDFGFNALRPPAGDDLARLLPEVRPAPVMLPAHVDAWVQTSPSPVVDPDVALWLHGPDTEPPDVQIVWRADIEIDDSSARAELTRADLLELCPPRTCEALSVPLAAARRWLNGQPAAAVADVDVARAAEDDEREPAAQRRERAALRWRGGRAEVVTASDLVPGDLLIVPASYGGLDPVSRTWTPDSSNAVRDLGDLAQVHEGRRPVLRTTQGYADSWDLGRAPKLDPDAEPGAREDALRDWLDRVVVPEQLTSVFEVFKGTTAWKPRGDLALLAPKRPSADVCTEPDVSSWTAVEATPESAIELGAHCRGVEEKARAFALRCGVPSELAADVALAARLHDVGKADPRFQAWLRNDVVPAAPLLAKSRLAAQDRQARRAARELSGYPKGGRHELLSVALVEGSPCLAPAHDPDLVLYLIGSHHGYGRPFAPFAPDAQPISVELPWDDGVTLRASSAHGYEALGSAVPERFWRLVRRYGWYGLAWLEALVRLADHRRSEEEAEGGAR